VAVKKLAAVAVEGDRRATLEALRDRLAADIDIAPATVTAQLAGKLQDILRELDELPVGAEVSEVDQITARYQARRAAAATAVHPSRGNVERRP
jgi:uncharacterized protein (DUF2267 family)